MCLATWCVVVSVWVTLLGLGIGLTVGLPGWSADLVIHAIAAIALAAVLLTVLQTTTAFMTGIGRGNLPPLAWTVLTLFLAQHHALGWGAWFPWAVPALVAGATAPRAKWQRGSAG